MRNDARATWLLIIAGLIVAMVVVGGLTRLTRSGLSIVEWRPITGAIPPLSSEDWEEEFGKYKEYPEFRKINRAMDLEGFRRIYLWEFAHRQLGRFMGIVYLFPFLYFWIRRQLSAVLLRRCFLFLALGGLQAGVGWIMVASGLVDTPSVSHYRLALHLSLALILYGTILYTALGLSIPIRSPRQNWYRAIVCFLIITALQILYGAFLAGLKAGAAFSDFPTLHGQWIPDGLLAIGWASLTEQPITLNFMHRMLAHILLLYSLGMVWVAMRPSSCLSRIQKISVALLAVSVAAQYTLGVTTALLHVPLPLAAMHQFGSTIVIGVAVFNLRLHSAVDPRLAIRPGDQRRVGAD